MLVKIGFLILPSCFSIDSFFKSSSTNKNKIDRFVEDQFFEHCFGAKIHHEMTEDQEKANAECSDVLEPPVKEVTTPIKPPLFLTLQWSVYPASTFPISVLSNSNLSNLRQKRSLVDQLDEATNKLEIKLKKMKCVLHTSGVTTRKGDIDVDGIVRNYETKLNDANLKLDLKKGVMACIKQVDCLESDYSSLEENHRQVDKAIKFVDCWRRKKKEACVKRSIREKLINQLKNNMSVEEIKQIMTGSSSSPIYYSSSVLFSNIVETILYAESL